MRTKAIVKLAIGLIIDYLILSQLLDREYAVLCLLGIMSYALMGEYIALYKHRAIHPSKLDDNTKAQLEELLFYVTDDVAKKSGVDLAKLRLWLIPSDAINAYAYGIRNLGITQGALNCCDDGMLCAVLGHEVAHVLHFDAVFHRIIFSNVTLIIISLVIISFVSLTSIWLLFILLCVLGICGGVFSLFLFRGANKLVKTYFTALQYAVIFVYQLIMNAVSRQSEFRADRYAVELGYGRELEAFLERFVDAENQRQLSLNEALYNSHPPVQKRLLKIEGCQQVGHDK